MNAIKTRTEFKYLETMAKRNGFCFNEKIYDPCLDRYIYLRTMGDNQFKAKYASLFITAWRILTND